MGVPVRRAQAGEGRHHDHAARVGHAGRQGLHVLAAADGLQAVAQPLHHGAGHEHTALQGVGRRGIGLRRGRGHQPVLRLVAGTAGVHQHEAAGAVGVLGQARLEAGLAEQRRLLVTRDAAHGNGRTEEARLAEGMARREHRRQHRLGHSQRLQQRGRPGVAADVEQHRARGVAHVGGVHAAFGQLPQEPAVDGAEGQRALRGRGGRAANVLEQPSQLGAAEVGVDDQPRGLAHGIGLALGAQLLAQRLGAPVLPDDGAVHRAAGVAPPQHGGLALVGDADGGDVGRREPRPHQRLLRHGELRGPDLVGVVLHPAWLRKVLGELALRHRHHAAAGVEDDGARAGSALVQRQQVFLGHRVLSSATGVSWRGPLRPRSTRRSRVPAAAAAARRCRARRCGSGGCRSAGPGGPWRDRAVRRT